MLTAFCGAQLLAPVDASVEAVLVQDGVIVGLVPGDQIPADAVRRDLSGLTLAPGFIDTQVNGGGGVLFNEAPTVETIRVIGEAHLPYGTTGFLPTLISDDLNIIDKAMRSVEEAIQNNVPGVVGIHVEGPFLSRAKRGIHAEDKLRAFDPAALALLSSLRSGVMMITVAPEVIGSEAVAALCAAGVKVSAGHTNATYDQMASAFASGVTGVTHLFNAMSSLQAREPGVVGAVLANQTAYSGIIVDGVHVHPAVLRMALRTRPLDRFMLVTDAMPSAGTDLASFVLHGREIRVEDGRCTDVDGTLAGAALTMSAAVRNAVALLGLTAAEAVGLASASPGAFLGLSNTGSLAVGSRADLVAFDQAFEVRRVWIKGELLYGDAE